MRYEYFLPEGNGSDTALRRRVRWMVDTCLRVQLLGRALAVVGSVTGKQRSASLAANLLGLVRDPRAPFKESTLHWALSYGSPALVRRLIDALSGVETRHWGLKVVRDVEPDLLLPCEHQTPDYQLLDLSVSRPDNALICFTGNGLKLNIPVQLFHCMVVHRFRIFIYLRDRAKKGYVSGIPSLGGSLSELSSTLRARIPASCRIAVVGVSGGGIAAARVADNLQADRLMLFSPPLLANKPDTLTTGGLDRIAGRKIFFGGRHEKDRQRAAQWETLAAPGDIELLDTNSHATLHHLYETGRLETLLDWLRGAGDTPREGTDG